MITRTSYSIARITHYEPLPTTIANSQGTLDALAARTPEDWAAFRKFVQSILSADSPLASEADSALFVKQADAEMHMPITIGDYTDFYASYEHAYNCGVLFRDPKNALQPNWKHLPVGYHGRASSVVVSGTPFHRPTGQILDKPGDKQPIDAPCRKLDYEVEIGVIYGGGETKLGERLSPAECRRRTFGLVLLNDWSARDIQAWEYVPLGKCNALTLARTVADVRPLPRQELLHLHRAVGCLARRPRALQGGPVQPRPRAPPLPPGP